MITDKKTLTQFQRKKILVLGGHGFIGRHLAGALLRQGAEVTVSGLVLRKNLRIGIIDISKLISLIYRRSMLSLLWLIILLLI